MLNRLQSATKSFIKILVTPKFWDRTGLEKTWIYFLPLLIAAGIYLSQFADLIGLILCAINAVWIWETRKK